MLTQRLARSANEFLTSEGVNPETAFLLGKDTNTFRDITRRLPERQRDHAPVGHRATPTRARS